jgi:hypothetical protein
MSGWTLLIIGLCSLALIAATAVWTGLTAWHIANHGVAVARRMAPVARDVTERAGTLESSVSQLQASAASIQDDLGRLRASAERLRIRAEALDEALIPYRSVRSFFGR